MFLAACVQLSCGTDVSANLASAEALIRRAAGAGAALVMTPENTPFLGPQFHKIDLAEPLDGPIAQRFSGLARELGIHLLIGSIAEHHDGERCFNTSLFFGPDGALLASYRKIHLFDVDIPGGMTIKESDSVVGGDKVVVVETALGKLGLTICYDLRFPEHYRALVDAGAEMITVPSAFTFVTGTAHWHTLLRARAIECQAWVFAPAQWGRHDAEGARHSYGHTLIVEPWGTVVADAPDGPGLVLAEVDLARVRAARQAIPVANHRRVQSFNQR